MSRALSRRLALLEGRNRLLPELAPFVARNGVEVLRAQAEIDVWRAVSPATRWPEVMILKERE